MFSFFKKMKTEFGSRKSSSARMAIACAGNAEFKWYIRYIGCRSIYYFGYFEFYYIEFKSTASSAKFDFRNQALSNPCLL